eukprot:jgi/Psemu1/12500/gm1.12500_g
MATLEILSIFCMIDDGDSEDEADPSDRHLKDRRTPRIAICRHCQSSFTYLFNSGNEQALLNCCGVDHKVFRDLLHLFQPVFDMITLPNKVEMEEYISAIGAKYPALHEKEYGALPMSQYYNGWTCDTYVSSVFVFAPDGRIRITAFNCLGSWHDSTVADYSVYDQMQEMFDEYGAMLTVDAAFKVRLSNYLIQSLQLDQVVIRVGDANDPGAIPVILNVMMLLYNYYQTSTVGHNQILNVFMHKKNGYFSYATEPTEDATGMFEFFRLFKPKLNGNTNSNVKPRSNGNGDSANRMLNINNRLLRFFGLFERGESTAINRLLPKPIHSIRTHLLVNSTKFGTTSCD